MNTWHVKRLKAERRFVWYGRSALGTALLLLFILLATLLYRGLGGFTQQQLRLAITFDAQSLGLTEGEKPEELSVSRFMPLPGQSLKTLFPEGEIMDLQKLVSAGAGKTLWDEFQKNPGWFGSTQEVWIPAAFALKKPVDLTEQQLAWVESLKTRGLLRSTFNTSFFTAGDSRQPEQAGFLGAIIGSLLTVAACLTLAFPLGVATAVYLEEFAAKSRFTEIIEVNINNLAAVPSIVFGLLGLAVYLNFMGMPRSAPLVGGLTLALMILPVIIIATRTALSAVPDSIRHGALALGASPMQAVWHHSLPLALPGIMTGTILGVARALGETAPLLMIGMVAFIADIPTKVTDPATVMPVQIYLWASSAEAGFSEKTASGIIVLLAVLLALNALAIYIRRRFEVRW